MEEVDKGCPMNRMGVRLVLAYLGSPGPMAIKRLCVCVCVCSYLLHYSGQFACQLIAKLYVVRKFE